MEFFPLRLEGAFLIDLELREDERGFFARSFCAREFGAHGLNSNFVQCNTSWSKDKGTLRGIHYQAAPHAEAKLVRCVRGEIYDVLVDLRCDSATYCQYEGVELSAMNRAMLYVPEGFGHAYQTLVPDTEVLYFVSEFYEPSAERAVRWNDPRFGIRWPIGEPVLSPKDRTHQDFVG